MSCEKALAGMYVLARIDPESDRARSEIAAAEDYLQRCSCPMEQIFEACDLAIAEHGNRWGAPAAALVLKHARALHRESKGPTPEFECLPPPKQEPGLRAGEGHTAGDAVAKLMPRNALFELAERLAAMSDDEHREWESARAARMREADEQRQHEHADVMRIVRDAKNGTAPNPAEFQLVTKRDRTGTERDGSDRYEYRHGYQARRLWEAYESAHWPWPGSERRAS